MAKRNMFGGMDVHKASIDIALAEEGREALAAPTRRLRFVYEAGPCDFGIHRYLTTRGEDCVVVNPSRTFGQRSPRHGRG